MTTREELTDEQAFDRAQLVVFKDFIAALAMARKQFELIGGADDAIAASNIAVSIAASNLAIAIGNERRAVKARGR